ncbi:MULTISPECIES: superinfection immunity protein [Acetobacter]|nr:MULTISPECIES: superinfection immunity protein [Acetobacter]
MEKHAADANGWSALLGLVIVLVGLALYFMPTIIAVVRKINKPAGVVAINSLLGWTLVGWVAALVMSFSMETKTDYELRTQAMMTVARMAQQKEQSL